MKPYEALAAVYDRLNGDVDYEALVPVLVKAVQELAGKKTKKKAAEAPAE